MNALMKLKDRVSRIRRIKLYYTKVIVLIWLSIMIVLFGISMLVYVTYVTYGWNSKSKVEYTYVEKMIFNDFKNATIIDATHEIGTVTNNDLFRYKCSDEEFDLFTRCVEAEVTGEEPKGLTGDTAYYCKMHVAQVILNRIESPLFPDTMSEVILQPYAFSPTVDGRFYTVEISDLTREVCRDALLATTYDTVDGCEFFRSDSSYSPYGMYVFTDEVGHSFFKSYI